MDTTLTAPQDVTLPAPPVLTGPQAQGDLLILPWPADVATARRAREIDHAEPVTRPTVLVTGANGHDHTLAPAPGVAWFAYPGNQQTIGVLTVAPGAVAVIGHIEHGDTYIGPGVYVIRRQREQADEARLVAD